MDTVCNVNHAVSILDYGIFESNLKNSPMLTLDSLNLIYSLLVGEVIFVIFETVFWTVRYINNRAKLKSSD